MATGITISRHGPNEQVIVARCLSSKERLFENLLPLHVPAPRRIRELVYTFVKRVHGDCS